MIEGSEFTVDVFIAYSSQDEARVRPLVELLRRHGLEVWIACEQPAGLDWDAEIDRVLANARCVLAIWSPSAVESPEVKGEARAAMAHGTLVSVSFEGALPPRSFTHLHAVDLTGIDADESSPRVEQMLAGIRSRIAAGRRGVEREVGPAAPAPSIPQRTTSKPRRRVLVPAVLTVMVVLTAAVAFAVFRSSTAVACNDDGVYRLSGQTFDSNTTLVRDAVCITDGATITVRNGAWLTIDTGVFIIEGDATIDGRGKDGGAGGPGDSKIRDRDIPPAFAGIRVCGKAPDPRRLHGGNGGPGGNGTAGATVVIRYGALEGDPTRLRVRVNGGKGGAGGAGGKGGRLWCKEGLSGYDIRGMDGSSGAAGRPGKAGLYSLGKL